MKKLLNPLRGSFVGNDLFCLSIYAAFITLFLIHEFSKFVSFELTDPSFVYYSEGTATGIDIGLRVKWMYRFLAGAATIFGIVFLLLKLAFKKNRTKKFHSDLILFALAGIILCISRVFGIDSTHTLSALFFLFLFKLVLVILNERGLGIPRTLLNSDILKLSVSFAFLLLFLIIFLYGTSSIVHKNYSSILFIATLILLIYYTICSHQLNLGARKATSILLPLVGIPYLVVLSVESFFYSKLVRDKITDHQSTFLILFTIFTLLAYIILYIKRKRSLSISKQYKRYIVPSLLFCYVVITSYEPVIDNVPDMFEPGNILNSHLRSFEFGQIPVLDFMSSHMLSEQWFGYIYSFIFGFKNDLSSLTYGFLNSIVFISVLYHLLLRLFQKETYALIFIMLFPFVSETFHFSVLFAILPMFFIKDLFEKPSATLFFKILLICSLLIIWRIDTGVVAIFGTVLFLVILYAIYPERVPFKTLLKGSFFFLLFGIIVSIICTLIRGPKKIFQSAQLFYHYVSGSQSHGHQYIYQPNVQQFYLYHIIYPILAVAMCLYIIYLLKNKYRQSIFNEGYPLVASLFLFILYIVHLQRGLVRHGFPEVNDDTIASMFYVAAALFVTTLYKDNLPVKKFSVFYSTTFLLFVTLKYFPINTNTIPIENGVTGNRFYNNKKPFEDSLLVGRVKIDPSFAHNNYLGLKRFMDSNLRDDQTFMDFSNTSMLYYYCKRRIPGYFNQNLENTIDDHLHFELLKELDVKKVPVVLFSNYPRNANDAMDNIPNVMRHYILAEYIFTHYKPLGLIDHKNVWVTDHLLRPLKDSLPQDPETYKPQHYDYKLIAEYLGYYYTKKNTSDLLIAFDLKIKNPQGKREALSFDVPLNMKKASHCFLGIEFEQKEQKIDPYQINVELLNDSSEVLGSFSFERRDKVSNTYMLRLSNHYLWLIKEVKSIRVNNSSDIISVKILNDIRPEHKNANIN